jgi:FlaA1/EpsC-like NDP-sugar epimerase
MITLEEGVELVFHAFEDMIGGEIYVKKIPSMKVTDLGTAICPSSKQHIVGIRPGEKLHEQMIGKEDASSTYEYKEYFKILPVINGWGEDQSRIKDGIKVPDDFTYNSLDNKDWMSISDLQNWILDNEANIGKI